jgi:hypothetical protein
MNIQLFIQNIEKYFGKYDNQTVKKSVEKFVNDNWKENDLSVLLNETIKIYPTQYKSQPDVSFFNKIWEEKNNPAEQAWLQLEELKTDRSLLCTDIVMQETITSMGGVNQFLDYRLTQHNWCKKNFIETYLRLSKQDLQYKDFRILKSDAQIRSPKYPPELFYDYDIKIIGNENHGRIMIESMKKTLGLEYKHKDMLSISDVMKNISIK